jgi:hypothetical protein
MIITVNFSIITRVPRICLSLNRLSLAASENWQNSVDGVRLYEVLDLLPYCFLVVNDRVLLLLNKTLFLLVL